MKALSKSIPKLVKFVKTVTSGFFQPLRELNRGVGRWVNSKLYPTYKSLPSQMLYERMMMDYFQNQQGEYWRVFREARVATLNKSDDNLKLELAMVVRDYFKLRAHEIESKYTNGARIQLKELQEVTLLVHEYFGLRASPTTDVLEKHAQI